jgi:Calcineurin-like phosphoesterase
MNYDLIGDIHGHSDPLVELLKKLDYQLAAGIFRHPERQVIFLGDFIDRGPNQREVISIVRPMIDSGSALSVMGNHEFNAIAYFTADPDNPEQVLRVHSDKNRGQHKAFLDAYEGAQDYAELIEWFRTLPLWLDRPGIRVVHACWDDSLIRFLKTNYQMADGYLGIDLLEKGSRVGSDEFEAIETLLKGKEVEMPNGQTFPDKDGNPRHHIRMRWWDGSARTYREAFLGPDSALSHIPEDAIDVDHLIEYSSDAPPVFIGHYWMDTDPALLAPNVACLDYSVAAKSGGKLVAYRWDGEQRLSNDKFVYVVKGPE